MPQQPPRRKRLLSLRSHRNRLLRLRQQRSQRHTRTRCNRVRAFSQNLKIDEKPIPVKINRTKLTGFKLSLALHAIVLGLLVGASVFAVLLKKPRADRRPLELVMQQPVQQIPVAVMSRPLASEDIAPAEVPKTVERVPVAAEPQALAPAKKPKQSRKQTNRVVRTQSRPEQTPPPSPSISLEEVQRVLTGGITMPSPVVLEPGVTDPVIDAYHQQVYRAMYAAWIQPQGEGARVGLKTEVAITIDPDGRISSRRKVSGSGHAAMDSSVMKTLESVAVLPPPPVPFAAPREVVIAFVLED